MWVFVSGVFLHVIPLFIVASTCTQEGDREHVYMVEFLLVNLL